MTKRKIERRITAGEMKLLRRIVKRIRMDRERKGGRSP